MPQPQRSTRLIKSRPGPALSKVTGICWWYAGASARQISYQHAMHKKYGPVARVGPNQVILSDLAALREVFGFGSGFVKSDWYHRFVGTKEGDNLFTTINPQLHAQRRKLLGTAMSETSLRTTFEPAIRQLGIKAVQEMVREQKENGRFDAIRWWFYMTTDVIGELTFGTSFNMLDKREENQYIRDLKTIAKTAILTVFYPWVFKLRSYLPFKSVKELAAIRDRTTVAAQDSISRYHDAMTQNPDSVKTTLFTKIWKSNEAGDITNDQLAIQARGYIIAGTDTTAYTLSYLLYELSRHQHWQDKIMAEIKTLPSGFTSKDVAALPNTQLAIQETLRVHGAVQVALPRVVPEQGLVAAGYFIPPGTEVLPQSYTIHRNEDIFPDAESWRPERWEKPTREMTEHMMAFGGGSRTCIGRHLAMMEINLGVAEFFQNFPNGIKLDNTTPDDMKHTEYFLAGPKSGTCWLSAL